MTRRIALLALAGLAAACGTLQQKEPPPKPFAGTRWDVVLEMPLPGEQPYLRFGDGRMEGFAGCNRINSLYLSDSVGTHAIAIRRIESGVRACDATAKLVENRILSTLQYVSDYQITGDVMKMTGSAGSLTLHAHSDAQPAAMASPVNAGAGLAGTRWVGVVEAGTSEGNVPRLELVAEGRLAGYSGCNLMSGVWQVQGGEARVGPLTMTKRACAGPESGIEQRVVAALNEGRLVRQDSKLVAVGKNGEKFEFMAAP
jgi:heat shock protein HslJ